MVDVMFKCDKCGSTLISHYTRDDNHSVKIGCADCGEYESINVHDYCSKYNKVFLEILDLLDNKE